MGTNAENNGPVLNGRRQKAAICISDTILGYSISKGGSARLRANMGEMAAIVGCLFFGAASFGQWLIPNSALGPELLQFKLSGTIMFFVFAALLYLIARRGLTVESQINKKNATLRIVRRNREGGSMVLAQHRFAEIDSVFIKRSKSDFIADQMFVRIKSGSAPLLIARGPAPELEPLLDRIQKDFRGQLKTAPKRAPKLAQGTASAGPRRVFATG